MLPLPLVCGAQSCLGLLCRNSLFVGNESCHALSRVQTYYEEHCNAAYLAVGERLCHAHRTESFLREHISCAGNINQLLLKAESYLPALEATQGVIAEFVNPKYKDDTRTAFKSSTRLECMMQDFPHGLPSDAKIGFTVINQVQLSKQSQQAMA